MKVHDLLADAGATNGIDPSEPSLILAPAGEPIFLVGTFKEEVSDGRVV